LPKYIVTGLLLVLAAATLCAQTLPKVKSLDRYWPEGEKRVYRFKINDTIVGTLETVARDYEISGGLVTSAEYDEKLEMDLTKIGLTNKFSSSSRLTVDGSGFFRKAESEVKAGEHEDNLEVVYDPGSNTIVGRKKGESQPFRSFSAPSPVYACDNNMIDQLELALAGQELSAGKIFTLPVVSPSQAFTAEFEFSVVKQTVVQYDRYVDTVWQVDMQRPARESIYIDRMHRLVKLVDGDQKLTVELIRDPFAERQTRMRPSGGFFSTQIARMPLYGFYLLVCAIWLIFLGRDAYKAGWAYLLFAIGGALYPVIYLAQIPLQEFYGRHVLMPALQSGSSLMIMGLPPALLTGLVQESLKLLPLYLFWIWKKPKVLVLISLGAFIGAGFGFVEAGHMTGAIFQNRLMASLSLGERVFTILFHIVMGTLMGYGLVRRQALKFWLAAVAFHTFGNYLVVFVQTKDVTIKNLEIILALYDILLLTGMVYIQVQFKKMMLMAHKAKK
jgi:hypothetical protein